MVIGSKHFLRGLNFSEFGRKFDDAASKSNVRVKFDNFDSSIVEIHKEDFDAFLDELTEVK
jgi:CDC45-like protein